MLIVPNLFSQRGRYRNNQSINKSTDRWKGVRCAWRAIVNHTSDILPSLLERKAKIKRRHCFLITNGPCIKTAGNFLNPEEAKYDEEARLEPEWKQVLEKLGRRCENNIKMEFKK